MFFVFIFIIYYIVNRLVYQYEAVWADKLSLVEAGG